MKHSMAAAALAAALLISPPADAAECAAGQWLTPASGDILDPEALLSRLTAEPRIVLLGEAHTTPAHHRWQAHMLSALHGRRADMAVGFEMLPRAAQPALDDWSAGRLTEAELLERSDWQRHWGYDAGFYLPLFHFARLHRVPTLALNVERELIAEVGREGWAAIGQEKRRGISDPAPASDAYRESLSQIYAYKQAMRDGGHPPTGAFDEEALEEIRDSDDFARFVEAQTTWDRAMAEVLADARRRYPEAVIVAIVGRGHAEYGHGIPHQLADLGIDAVDVLLPWSADAPCDEPPAGIARALFVVDENAEDAPPPRPRLGVMIETADDGVRVSEVVDDSVAAISGVRAGDVIREAAGFATATTADLIDVVRRQAPGTWLPLMVARDGEILEIVARFPQRFE